MTAKNPALGKNSGLSAVGRRSVLRDAPALSAAATPVLSSPETPIQQFFAGWFRLERATYGTATLSTDVFEAAAEAMAEFEDRISEQFPTSIEDVALKVVALTCFGEYCLPPGFHDELAELMASAMSVSATPV